MNPHRARLCQPGRTAAKVFSLAVLVAGLAVLMYPAVSKWYATSTHAQAVTEYSLHQPDSAFDQFETARQANEVRDLETAGQALVVVGSDVRARVQVPAVDIDLPVYATSSPDNLQRGAGILEGTSLPVGGAGTHAGITAHSGMVTAFMFDRLDDVALGDHAYVEVLGQTLAYSVISRVVDTPEDGAGRLQPQTGKDLLTLITCTPYGINTHRLLVTAERDLAEEMRLAASASSAGEPAQVDSDRSINAALVAAALIPGALAASALVIRNKTRKRRNATRLRPRHRSPTRRHQAGAPGSAR